MNHPLDQKNIQRMPVLDGLRGLSILAIFIYHCIIHFNFKPFSTHDETGFLIKADLLIQHLSYTFLYGKFYSIFSLLFGLTIFLQFEKKQNSTGGFAMYFAWRLFVLFLFGCLNSIFFPGGDILVLYSLIGILLIPLLQAKTYVLVILASLFLIQPLDIYNILNLIGNPSFSVSPTHYETIITDVNNAASAKDIWYTVWINLTKGQLASILWSFESGRLFQVIGLFLCGIIAGRTKIFNTVSYNKKYWNSVLLFTTLVGAFVFLLKASIIKSLLPIALKSEVIMVYSLWLNLFLTITIVSVFTILFNTSSLQKTLYPLIYLGKISLTVYILQSVIGALIFFPWGLGAELNITYSFLLSATLGIGFLIFSRSWVEKYKHGPLEKIWRKLTKSISEVRINESFKQLILYKADKIIHRPLKN